MENVNKQFKILSLLLQYPDEAWIRDLEDFSQPVETIFAPTHRYMILQLIRYFRKTPLLKLQADYSTTFDFTSDTCLNLTYHRYGDAIERGAALARFAEIFEDAGYLIIATELPDFLPMVLELLSVSRKTGSRWVIETHLDTVSKLAHRLNERTSPYAAAFDVLAEILTSAAGDNYKET